MEIPNSEGLLIRQEIVQRTKQSSKSKRVHRLVQQKRYGALKLQVKRGRKRQDSKYRNRVGARADKLRKVCHLLTIQNSTCVYVHVTKRKLHMHMSGSETTSETAAN